MYPHFSMPRKVVLLVAVLTGIAAATADTIPERGLLSSLPDQWQYETDYTQPSPTADKWWQTFHDATLDSLIRDAEANNYNVATALKRIELAKKEVGLARSAYYPTLGVSAGWTRQQTAGAVTNPVTNSRGEDFFSLGANMNWEIDVFGRVAANVKAEKAAVDVSRADYDGVIVALCANVAKTYFQLRTLQAQRAVAVSHIAQQEKILKMTEARFEAGIGDMLEVTQAKVVLYSTRATLPGLDASIRTSINALTVLTGAYPSRSISPLLKAAPMPEGGAFPELGVPADLLRRRPDVVGAEKQLAQYAAMVGVAKKDFLPTLAFTGSIGTDAHKAGNLFGSHSLGYSVAPVLSWTIFDGFARNLKVAEAKLQMEAAIDNYNLTVQNAVEEVDNALAQYEAQSQECQLLTDLVKESEKSVELAVDRYKNGLSAFTNVVDALMNYLEYQNSLVSSRGEVLASLVNIYQALGGGY